MARERAQSFLTPAHQAKILNAYQKFTDQLGFASVVKNEDILAQDGNLSVPRYVKKHQDDVILKRKQAFPMYGLHMKPMDSVFEKKWTHLWNRLMGFYQGENVIFENIKIHQELMFLLVTLFSYPRLSPKILKRWF